MRCEAKAFMRRRVGAKESEAQRPSPAKRANARASSNGGGGIWKDALSRALDGDDREGTIEAPTR
jgi:hypothetical protein